MSNFVSARVALLLVTFAVAVWGYGVYPMISDWIAVQSWQPQSATLQQHSLSEIDHFTGEEAASYSYIYNIKGQIYEGKRIGLYTQEDNSGLDYDEILRGIFRTNENVIVWVDPDRPERAIINRQISLKILLSKCLLPVIFLLFSGACLYLVGRHRRKVALESFSESDGPPWLNRKEWSRSIVQSLDTSSRQVLLNFALIWNMLSLPAIWLFYFEFVQGENAKAIIALLFPLMGFLFITWALRARRRWQLIGPTPMTLDPYPGAIGGDIGGYIDIDEYKNTEANFVVTVTCLHSRAAGQAQKRRIEEDILWQEQGLADIKLTPEGMRLSFGFAVPPTLPESMHSDDESYTWRVFVEGDLTDDIPMQREFEIPVFKTGQLSSFQDTTSIVEPKASRIDGHIELTRFMTVSKLGSEAVKVDYSYGRYRIICTISILLSAITATIGYFLLDGVSEFIRWFMVSGGIIGACTGLYIMANRLSLTIDEQGIKTCRFFLGIPIRRRFFPAEQLVGFMSENIVDWSATSKRSRYYNLYVINDEGQMLLIGEGFNGKSQVRIAEEWFSEHLSFEVISRTL